MPYIYTGATRTANRERLPRVHASTAPADYPYSDTSKNIRS